MSTFRWAAEEARRFSGELQRLDTDPAATGRIALVRRVPRGPVLGIAPFNFPLNLVAHKVAPALAVGAPIIVKPAPATPLSALLLGEILAEHGPARRHVLGAAAAQRPRRRPGRRPPAAGGLVHRLRAGRRADPPPGAGQARHAGTRRQRGGGDLRGLGVRRGPRLRRPADRHLRQLPGRAVLHRRAAGPRARTPLRRASCPGWSPPSRSLRTGDPTAESTDVGPLVSVEAAQRVEAWVDEAVAAGRHRRDRRPPRRRHLSAHRARPACRPSPRSAPRRSSGRCWWWRRSTSDDAAFAAVNDSAYGLQAGVFTHRLDVAFVAARALEVGGVIVGDVPSYRADQMPYGGRQGQRGRPGGRAVGDGRLHRAEGAGADRGAVVGPATVSPGAVVPDPGCGEAE